MKLFTSTFERANSLSEEKFCSIIKNWNRKNEDREVEGMDLSCSYAEYESSGSKITVLRTDAFTAIRVNEEDSDGTVWSTDCFYHKKENKVTFQHSLSYRDEARPKQYVMHVPGILEMFVDDKCFRKNPWFGYTGEPKEVSDSMENLLCNLINGSLPLDLPVVYVSRTSCNSLFVDVEELSRRLKGIAYVLVQKDSRRNFYYRQMTDGKNEYNGSIGIYYPNGLHCRVFTNNAEGRASYMMKNTVRLAFRHATGTINPFTFDELLTAVNRAQNEKDKADVQELIESFDEDYNALKQKLYDLQKERDALLLENERYKKRVLTTCGETVLVYGMEKDLYPGEIRDKVLSILDKELADMEPGSRSYDILCDMLEANQYERLGETKRADVKKLLKCYTVMTGPTKQGLMDLGISVSDGGKHHKLVYHNDPRYWTTLAKTPSDTRGSKNIASLICKSFF